MGAEGMGKEIVSDLVGMGEDGNKAFKESMDEKADKAKDAVKDQIKGRFKQDGELNVTKPIPGAEEGPTLSNETREKIEKLLNGETDTITVTSKELEALTEHAAKEGAKKAMEELSVTGKLKDEIEALIENKVEEINKTGTKWKDAIVEKRDSILEKGKEFGRKAIELGKNLAGKGKEFFKKWLDNKKEQGRSIAYNLTGAAEFVAKKISELSGRAGEGLGNIREGFAPKKQEPEKGPEKAEPQVEKTVSDAADKLTEEVKKKAVEKAAETVGVTVAGPAGGAAVKAAEKVVPNVAPKTLDALKSLTSAQPASVKDLAGKAVETAGKELAKGSEGDRTDR